MIERKEIEHLLKEEQRTFWGTPVTSYDYLIDKVHGDGDQLVYLTTFNSRPFCYYIRVDSALDLEKDDDEILDEEDGYWCFTEMLLQMIEGEVGNIDGFEEIESGLYYDKYDDNVEPFEYEWPMLRMDTGIAGYGVQEYK